MANSDSRIDDTFNTSGIKEWLVLHTISLWILYWFYNKIIQLVMFDFEALHCFVLFTALQLYYLILSTSTNHYFLFSAWNYLYYTVRQEYEDVCNHICNKIKWIIYQQGWLLRFGLSILFQFSSGGHFVSCLAHRLNYLKLYLRILVSAYKNKFFQCEKCITGHFCGRNGHHFSSRLYSVVFVWQATFDLSDQWCSWNYRI